MKKLQPFSNHNELQNPSQPSFYVNDSQATRVYRDSKLLPLFKKNPSKELIHSLPLRETDEKPIHESHKSSAATQPNVYSYKPTNPSPVRRRSIGDIFFGSDKKLESAKLTIVTNCRKFYQLGWVFGSGGGMSIKIGDNLVIAPSGVEKEMMESSDMWITDLEGNIVSYPNNSKHQMVSECTPIFVEIYRKTNAMAIIHSHSKWAVLVTKMFGNAFGCSELEMIKGIHGFGYMDRLEIPIIENTPRECELTSRICQAIVEYPDSYAVLVRNHGVYIWGRTPVETKKHAECLHYLFELIVETKKNILFKN